MINKLKKCLQLGLPVNEWSFILKLVLSDGIVYFSRKVLIEDVHASVFFNKWSYWNV